MTVQIQEAIFKVHKSLYFVIDFSQDNKTPLHYVAESGHSDVVQALLDRGAKVDVVDNVSLLNYKTIVFHCK